jgi:hypothetical protein
VWGRRVIGGVAGSSGVRRRGGRKTVGRGQPRQDTVGGRKQLMSVRRRTSARRQLRARPPNAERYGPKIPHVKPTRERAEPEVRGRQQSEGSVRDLPSQRQVATTDDSGVSTAGKRRAPRHDRGATGTGKCRAPSRVERESGWSGAWRGSCATHQRTSGRGESYAEDRKAGASVLRVGESRATGQCALSGSTTVPSGTRG